MNYLKFIVISKSESIRIVSLINPDSIINPKFNLIFYARGRLIKQSLILNISRRVFRLELGKFMHDQTPFSKGTMFRSFEMRVNYRGHWRLRNKHCAG